MLQPTGRRNPFRSTSQSELPVRIERFGREHIDAAADLFAEGYRCQRRRVPALPARHEDPGSLGDVLDELVGISEGVAATEAGRLVGYLFGIRIPSFKGTAAGIYAPVWAHGARGNDRAAVYQEIYEAASRRWAELGCPTHVITIYPDDEAATETLFRNGFGLLVVDALRGSEPFTAAEIAGVSTRAATVEDIDMLLPLTLGLGRHLAAAPIFLPLFELPSREHWLGWFLQRGHRVWIATAGGEAVAYLRCQPPTSDVAYVAQDDATIAITGAYTKPEWRGQGISRLLLVRALDWARQAGYERCSVDFESANSAGSAFWLRNFQPICHSLIRRADDRVCSAENLAWQPAVGG